MCIILSCERGARPSFELVDNCFWHNPDGAGLMWHECGAVQIAKGFTDSCELFTAIEAAPLDSPLVIHMRIATSGGVDVGTCHPFPICDDLDSLHAPNVECSAALAHNGIIIGMRTDDARGISATVAFVAGQVAPMWREDGIVTRRMRERIRLAAPRNRFAIMNADGDVYRIGSGWETVTRGIYASNDTWRDMGLFYGLDDEYRESLFDDGYRDTLEYLCGDCCGIDWCAKHGALCDGIDEAATNGGYTGFFDI